MPRDQLQSTLDHANDALQEAYNNAYPVCCGRASYECCGDPDPEWPEADQRVMDVLGPIQRELSAMLADLSQSEQPEQPIQGNAVSKLPERDATHPALATDLRRRYGERPEQPPQVDWVDEQREPART